ncbi:DUF3618 domain-containing protein [Telmatospirillum sp. J64-1]|uniref:DUF3618 domain-containing protein n=1 Tax=Telmatospirillum sp. J64-1 TaxID=2502183 RepID=UPI00115E3FFE|nr:DUF3618 domain-containing protein [Telmatospirillum sp. J64-1]
MAEQRSPEEIQREIEETRRHAEATIQAIEERLSPGRMLDDGLAYLRESESGRTFTDNLRRAISENPIPLTLIAVGIGWMMMESMRDPAVRRRRREEWAGDVRNRHHVHLEQRKGGRLEAPPSAERLVGGESSHKSARESAESFLEEDRERDEYRSEGRSGYAPPPPTMRQAGVPTGMPVPEPSYRTAERQGHAGEIHDTTPLRGKAAGREGPDGTPPRAEDVIGSQPSGKSARDSAQSFEATDKGDKTGDTSVKAYPAKSGLDATTNAWDKSGAGEPLTGAPAGRIGEGDLNAPRGKPGAQKQGGPH